MAKDKAKPIRCLIDATKIPPSAFALPDDGRKEKSLWLKRKVLFAALASFANWDGSSSFPSKSTLQKSTDFSLSTIGRLLSDLRKLGYLEAGDLNAFYKTRIWKLNVAKTESDSGKEAESDSQRPSQIRSETASGSKGTTSGSQSAALREPDSLTAHALPPIVPPSPTRSEQQAGGWRLLEEKHMAAIGYFGRRRADFQKLIDEFGFDIVNRAVLAALGEGGFENVKSIPGVVLHRLGQQLAIVVKSDATAEQQKRDEAALQSSIDKQREEIVQRLESTPAIGEDTRTPEEFMAEN